MGWNILGECKATIGSEKANSHTEWVSCVRFSPNPSNPLIISCGWDKAVKVWDLKGFGNSLKYSFRGHTGYVNTVAVSPGGAICALEFSPSKYWLCAATDNGIRVWDLESRNVVCNIDDFAAAPSFGKRRPPCTCLAWSADGRTLFAGYADHIIRVWEFRE